jgi:hypothetical protein
MRGVETGVAILLALAATTVLAGCDPYGPAYPDGSAFIDIQVRPDGTAVTEIFFDGQRERSSDELLSAADAAAHIFTDPGAIPDISINGNSGGYPFAVVTTEQVFVPGAAPVVRFDTTDAVEYLLDDGVESVSVSLRVLVEPMDPDWQPPSNSGEPDWPSWDEVSDSSDAPRGVITLHPEPNLLRAYGSVIGPLVGLVAAFLSITCLVGRRHGRAAVLATVALTAAVLGLAANGYDEVGELVAAGGPGWPYALFIPLGVVALLALVPGSAVLLILGLAKVPAPFVVFNAPPQWPAPPPSWLPPPRWTPPDSWPAAPDRWEFLITVAKNNPNANRSRGANASARSWLRWYQRRRKPAIHSGDAGTKP